MSPRHFARMLESKEYKDYLEKQLSDQIQPGMNFWYAFTAVSGIAKLFSYTPDIVQDNPVKDSQSGTENNTPL